MKLKYNEPSEDFNVNNPLGITIGSFDGVHKGHQYLLDEFQRLCTLKKISPVVISFTPHPLVFIGKKENFLLNSSHKKREYLKKKFDVKLIEIEFTEEIKKMSGDLFFKKLLEKLPGIKLLFAGHDFSLGANKEYNFEKAKKSLTGIELIQAEKFNIQEQRISSSSIRELLICGEIEKANFLLGHPFSLSEKVKNGNEIGRTLGFPTANLEFDKTQLLPRNGVYYTRCHYKGKAYRSIVNIGTRPTVTDDYKRVVEVHIFDFNKKIYNEEIELEFFSKVRDEVKFSSKEELVEQINLDIEKCLNKYYYGEMGLIGKYITHSKSRDVYQSLLGIEDLSYKLIDIEVISKEILVSLLKKIPYISITAPYKKNVYSFVDKFEGIDLGIESVNAIKLEGDKVIGTNTDLMAIKEILNRYDLSKEKVIVLGDGAMGSIIEKTLENLQVGFDQLSRKKNNLKNLSSYYGENLFIINALSRSCTPVLHPKASGLFWDLNYAQEYEKVFKGNPLLRYINGEELLMLQAKFALSFWNLKGD